MLAGSASLRVGDARLSRLASWGSYWARPRGIGSMPPLKAGNAFSSVRDIPLPRAVPPVRQNWPKLACVVRLLRLVPAVLLLAGPRVERLGRVQVWQLVTVFVQPVRATLEIEWGPIT